MSEVLFIRHGYTPSNNANYNEQTGIRDIIKFDELCPLEKKYGMKQSEELGEFLGNHLKDKKVLWIMSPYVRAKETSIIAAQNLVNSGANINFMVDNSLREINQGLVYGINYREKNEQISEYVDEIYYQSLGTDKEIAIPNPGGESELDVRRRVKSFADEVKYIKTVSDYNAIVILSHGTVNKWVYYWLNNKQAAPKQVTFGVFNDAGQVLFEPATFVPKGYYVDLKEYEETTKLVSSIAFPFQDFLFMNNIDFVLDANLMLYLDVLRDRCKNYGYKLFIIEIEISPTEALKRSLNRLNEINLDNLSNSDEADFKLFLDQLSEYKKTEKPEYIFAKINTETGDIAKQLDEIIIKIRNEISS